MNHNRELFHFAFHVGKLPQACCESERKGTYGFNACVATISCQVSHKAEVQRSRF